MTFLRSALFNLLFLGGTAIAVVLALPLLASPSLLMRYVRLWARGVILLLRWICGIRVVVTGLDNIPTGGAIIAAKHQSAFDTIVWLVLLPRVAYVLKKELLDLPIWGWLAQRCGHIPVDRAAGAPALRGMVRTAQMRLAEGRPIVIFPEGTRTAPGERGDYQPGVAAMAIATRAPVVPVATDSGLRWGKRAFLKPAGPIHVAILPPLPAGLPRAALMTQLETAIEDETARLTALSRDCG